MSVLVVIPTLNEAVHIASVIAGVRAEVAALNGRIVVTDGGSTDGTRDIVAGIAARDEGVVLMDNPDRYQGAGINRAQQVEGDGYEWMIRLDAHSAYPEGYCRTLVEEARETGAASVVVSMLAEGRTPMQRLVAEAQNSRFGNGASAHRNATGGRWVDHGHHALMRLDAFRAMGGYAPGFTHNEDAELDFRLTRAGYRIWLTGRTYVTYFPRAALGPLMRQYFNFGRGRRRNLAKNGQRPALRQVVVAALAPSLLLSVLSWLHPVFALPLLLWVVGCIVAGVLIMRDTGRAASLLAGPIAGTMHLAWSLGYWRQALSPVRGNTRKEFT
ncbi:hypothetical protein LCGC14_0497700 [marine sediment metagenome]|uniref:Glycosyltransferase 2-like domain-containing protein n=1 Tax=marine sediment metagenome TaxID=412755 RepID=A0A0F9S4S5_9ZZZZ